MDREGDGKLLEGIQIIIWDILRNGYWTVMMRIAYLPS